MSKETAGEALADTLFRWALEDESGDVLDGWIYFIVCDEPRAVKIGFTKKHPRQRLKQLQTGNPSKLWLLGWYPGSQGQEQELHRQMSAYRMSGEWFRIGEGANEILAEPLKRILTTHVLTGRNPDDLAQ